MGVHFRIRKCEAQLEGVPSCLVRMSRGEAAFVGCQGAAITRIAASQEESWGELQ
jgi:hypothetical protein